LCLRNLRPSPRRREAPGHDGDCFRFQRNTPAPYRHLQSWSVSR
jgi:hypothetical protein